MAAANIITVFLPGQAPVTYDLDSFRRNDVLMGRGEFHGEPGQRRNDISIDVRFKTLSRAHCVFFRDDNGRWFICDDHSTNGLIFQGRKVDNHLLNDGDNICIGTEINDRIVIQYSSWQVPDGRGDVSPDVPPVMIDSHSLKGKDLFVIGRAADCDIVIPHPAVSRRHCIITRENGSFYIADNNSKNGVLLNSRPLTKKEPLNQMDRISIAGISFVFSNDCMHESRISGGVSLSAEHLSKKAGKGRGARLILDDVNLFIEPNQFVAIIGGSGAGKTTLLNCLSGMSDFNAGDVFINGESVRTGGRSLSSLMGYVPQEDIVYDSLTLERMLYYSAKLRMPEDSSREDIKKKISETLSLMELDAQRRTMISKLSGGERKRASIAVELLASPRLFFLDEPSSGLDPGTERHLMQTLKKLADSDRTVVMITHTVQNIDLCDRVICMGKGGKLCFEGTPGEVLRFFGKNSMTDIYDDLNDRPDESAARYKSGLSVQRSAAGAPAGEKTPKRRKNIREYLKDFLVLTCRYMEIMRNSLLRLLLLILMPIGLALLVCAAFEADGGFLNFLMRHGSLITRQSFPFLVGDDTMKLVFAFSCAAFWTGIFNSVQEISKERNIFERERFSGVGTVPYVMSKFVPLTLLCLIQSACMTAILTFLSNTAATVDGNVNNTVNAAAVVKFSMRSDGLVFGSGMMWLETYLTTFLCVLSAMALGLLISSAASNEMALVLCPICLMPQILFSGIVTPLSGLTETLSKIISCKWSCVAYLVSARVNDLYESCKYDQGVWVLSDYSDFVGMGAAYDTDTTYLLEMNGIQSGWLALILISAVCVTAAALILRFRHNKTR